MTFVVVEVEVTSQAVNMRARLSYTQLFKLWFKSMFYHVSFSRDYTMDTLVEPLFWVVDHFVGFLGRFFVVMVGILVGSIIIISHLIGIPVFWPYSPTITVCMFGVGYWIILNLTFNFVQGVRVSPGLPSDLKKITSSVTICKKCISPKPARTHHCSICNRCYLNMDHHCPWMNNCVGHFNRRYFYLSMVYIVIGCLYVMILGLSLAYRQVIQGEDILPFEDLPKEVSDEESMNSQLGLPISPELQDALITNSLGNLFSVIGSKENSEADATQRNNSTDLFSPEQAELLFGIRITRVVLLVLLYYATAITVGASLALGGLIIWHGKLIHRGETSIEYHINKAERLRIGKEFVNPYDLGWRKNWELFLGLDQKGKTFWKSILFPSAHRPTGNGYDWCHITEQTVGSFDSMKQL